jgi:hypothetical protein
MIFQTALLSAVSRPMARSDDRAFEECSQAAQMNQQTMLEFQRAHAGYTGSSNLGPPKTLWQLIWS